MTQASPIASCIYDIETIRNLVRVNTNLQQDEERILEIIQSSGALLKGHFGFGSEGHSGTMLRFANLGSMSSYLEFFAKLLLVQLSQRKIKFDGILTPDSAAHLAVGIRFLTKKRLIYVDTDEYAQPIEKLINEEDLYRNDRILLSGNLISRGRNLRSLIDLVRQKKAFPVAIALFAIKDEALKKQLEDETGLKVFSVFRLLLEGKAWPKEECPLCKEGIPILYSREV